MVNLVVITANILMACKKMCDPEALRDCVSLMQLASHYGYRRRNADFINQLSGVMSYRYPKEGATWSLWGQQARFISPELEDALGSHLTWPRHF